MHVIDIIRIILYVFEALFALFFVLFSIVFFKHKRMKHIDYVLKERFNRIEQFAFTNKFKYLQYLAKNNEEIKNILDKTLMSKQIFDNKILILKAKLLDLTTLNSKYFYKKSNNLINDIKNDLNILETSVDQFKMVNLSATDYSKNISDLLIEFRAVSDLIIDFYEHNLQFKYNLAIFSQMKNEIFDLINEAFNLTSKTFNDEATVKINTIHQKIVSFFDFIGLLYAYDYVFLYLKSSYEELKQTYNKNLRILSNTDIQEIDKNISLIEINIKQFETALKNCDLAKAKAPMILAIKKTEQTLAQIKIGDFTNSFIQKNISFLNMLIKLLKSKINDLIKAFDKIQKIFHQKDQIIVNIIDTYKKDIKTICFSYENIENE
jgi:hypothetical protein